MYYEIEHYDQATNTYTIIEVDFIANIRRENSGIGSYEYWGSKGFDAGQDYFEIDDLSWDKSLYTESQNEKIEVFMDVNYDKIIDKLIESEKNNYI